VSGSGSCAHLVALVFLPLGAGSEIGASHLFEFGEVFFLDLDEIDRARLLAFAAVLFKLEGDRGYAAVEPGEHFLRIGHGFAPLTTRRKWCA
jgi:hypothetical protein